MPITIPASTLEKFTTFGDLLRFLRRRVGTTQMELADAVGYSDAQISRLEQNLRLPDIPIIEARFVSALGLENEPKAVARLLELAANVRREDAPALGLCPYKGLSYFDEADTELFVGREVLTSKLVERTLSLTSDNPPRNLHFLAVVGASGSGKSSLVRAGLVSALRWNKQSVDWQIYILTPTVYPLESLAASLTQRNNAVMTTASLMDDLARDPRSLKFFIKRKLQSENGSCLLLVVDQFEELFALCRSEEERAAFIDNLLAAASDVDTPIIVVITLRADFYAHCANYPELREALADHQEYIGAMNSDELRRAIEEPARRGRWELEPGLVDLLLRDVGSEPGALPLLSHALLETWLRRRGHMMTLSGYASSGGVRGAIAETAETIFSDQFTREQQTIARRIFLRLTELGDESVTADTRRRATFSELILKPEETAATRSVLKSLADARLIMTAEDSAEVAHEALIREWPTLRGWLEENREGLRLHRQLTDAAQEWSSMKRESDLLYRGVRLAHVREWANQHREDLNALEHDFLNASIEQSEREVLEREEQRQRELEAAQKLAETEQRRAEAERQRAEEQTRSASQLRKRAFYLTGAFVTALIMAVMALFFGTQARQSATTAQSQQRIATSRELAAASISNLEVDPERSILLALKALDVNYTIEAEDALHRAIQASRVQAVIPAHEPSSEMLILMSPNGNQFVTSASDGLVKTWDTATGKQLLNVDGFYAAFSPNGQRLAISTPDGSVKMIDTATGNEIHIFNQIHPNWNIVFSPDGSRIAVAKDNRPSIWDAETGEKLIEFPGHTEYVGYVEFSPDGIRLLTSSNDGTARVWNAITGEQILSLSNHPGIVWVARYSPDGKLIASVSENETYIWNAETGQKLFTLQGDKGKINAITFSADSSRLAIGGVDRSIKVWNTKTGKELFTLLGHTGAIHDMAFSLDGTRLFSISDDGTVRIWDLTPSYELLTIQRNGAARSTSFIMQGSRLVVGSAIGDVRVWETSSGKELQPLFYDHNELNAVAFSPDGKHFAVATANTAVQVLDTASGAELLYLKGHTRQIYDVAFSPDGSRLATAGEDWQAKLWDARSGKLLFTLQHLDKVLCLAFSPDGTKLVTGSNNGTVKVWDTASGKELLTFDGHDNSISDVVFSPDGKRIVSASLDGTAKIWDTGTGKNLFTLRGHTSFVTAVAFSPDGKRLATVSLDGSTKLWNVDTGEEMLTLLGSGSALTSVAFDADGKRLAVSGDNETRLYELEIDDLIALARKRVTRQLTTEECQKYLHLDKSVCSPALRPAVSTLPPLAHNRVCMIAHPDSLSSLTDSSLYMGIQEAVQNYGWESIIKEVNSYADTGNEINKLISSDCDLIVTVFFNMADAVHNSSKANPNQKFLLLDATLDPPLDNSWGQIYSADQAAFLTGYVAASVTKTGKVGTFGGVDFESVLDIMDGFTRGVAYYNEENGTDIEMLGWDVEKRDGLFIGSFSDQEAGQRITRQLMEEGADVILPVAGDWVGTKVLRTVHEAEGAYVIGADTDWALTYPEFADIILTSIEKRMDVSVIRTVQSIVDGTFTGGTHIGTLETGEVDLAPFHELDPLISLKVKADLEQIKKDIIAGKIKTKP